MNKLTKKEYKKFCEDNHLRYAVDDCHNPISPTKRRSYQDHLYWTGNEEIGVFVERESKAKYKHLKEKLLRLGCELNQDGDTEGTFFISQDKVSDVAQLIRAKRNNVSVDIRKRMSERMAARWANEK